MTILKIKGKKAQIFALLITLAVLLTCGYALFKFITAKTGAADLFNSPQKILDINYETEKFEFFMRESARLAVLQAYQQIADEGGFAASNCIVESGYINFCSLAPDIDIKFAAAIEESANRFILFYPNQDFNKISYKVSIKDNKINFNGNTVQIKTASEGFFSYSATYNFEPSFSLSLSELNLNSFQEIWQKVNECKTKEDIITCMKGIENFDIDGRKSDNKIFFDLKSKKEFFIDNSYKNIEIKFSI